MQDIIWFNVGFIIEINCVVDFWCICYVVINCVFFVYFVDNYQNFMVYFFLQVFGGNLLLQLYEMVLVFFFNFFWNLVRQGIGVCIFNWVVFKVVNVIQMCFFQEVEQYLEIFFCFVREVDNKG